MNADEPHHRNVAMAFESYALYPHYSVRENPSSPLKALDASSLHSRLTAVCKRSLSLLNIQMLLDRPLRMLNGQKQRGARSGDGTRARRAAAG